MPIPFVLDDVIESLRAEWTDVTLLRDLTGVHVPPHEARIVWPRVLEHKWYLSERLGRDVGLRVAAVDFFENIRPRAQRRRRSGRRQLEARGS